MMEEIGKMVQITTTIKVVQKLKVQTLMDAAIKLVMKGNQIKFDNLLAKQVKCVAMGMSPAPPSANLFVGILKKRVWWINSTTVSTL